jgi:hypothetical protein
MLTARGLRRPLIAAALTLATLLALSSPAGADFGVRLKPEAGVVQTSASADGFDESTTCPPGTVVTAMAGSWNNYLSSVVVACQSFSLNGTDLQTGGTYAASLPMQGIQGTNTGSSSCPAGSAAVGLGSQVGLIFDGTRLACQGFSGSALTGSPADASLVGTGGGVYSQSTCPSGQVMTGLQTDSVVFDSPNSFGAMIIECSSIQSVGQFQPDLVIEGKGDGVYEPNGGTQSKVRRVYPGKATTFHVDIQADGDTSDVVSVEGWGSRKQFKVGYTLDGVDVTDQVVAGTLDVAIDGPGTAPPLLMLVKLARHANPARTFQIRVGCTSGGSPTLGDSVDALVKARR